MTTSMGLKPIDTEHHSLLSLSSAYPSASRISETHLHSQATSPTDSESIGFLASQSSTRSFVTIASSVDESKPDSTKASGGAQDVLQKPTETCFIAQPDMDAVESKARESPSSDLLETGSDVSRTSYRTRKPTPKAQALLGTKLYRSFTQEEQKDVPLEKNDKDLDTIAVAEKQQEVDADRLTRCSQKVDEDDLTNAVPSDMIYDSQNMNDDGLEGSQSKKHISRRQSTRERKPASRLIESDELIKTPKRKILHNPATASSAKRIKLSVTPSKLRACLDRTDNAEDQAAPTFKPLPRVSTVKVEAGATCPPPISTDELKSKSLIVVLKLPSNLRKPCDEYVNNESPKNQENSRDAEPPESKPPDRTLPDCDLSCLTPESLLLACADIAADWPDSDNEDNPKIEPHEQTVRLKQQLVGYCQCQRNETGSFKHADSKNKKAGIGCGKALS